MRKLLNKACLFYFNFGWYAIAILAQKDLGLLSFLVVAIGYVLLIISKEIDSAKKIAIYAAAFGMCIFGMGFDFLMNWLGYIYFPITSNPTVAGFPTWMIAIWLLFSIVLPFTLEIFQGRRLAGAIATAIFGPISYLTARGMGIFEFRNNLVILGYALFWMAFYLVADKIQSRLKTYFANNL